MQNKFPFITRVVVVAVKCDYLFILQLIIKRWFFRNRDFSEGQLLNGADPLHACGWRRQRTSIFNWNLISLNIIIIDICLAFLIFRCPDTSAKHAGQKHSFSISPWHLHTEPKSVDLIFITCFLNSANCCECARVLACVSSCCVFFLISFSSIK